MPPWFADARTGHFSNDPSLSDSERQIITGWVDHGAKEGNPDPSRTIRWGEPSEEEMMSGWIDYIEAPNTAAAQPVISNGVAAR
jgi:hypothetical protein